MNKELDEAWTTIYHYNDEIIHDMGSEYVENPLKEEIDIVNNALIEAQKQEKVLEIIKEKDVDIKFLRALINSDSEYTRKNALKIYNLCLDSETLTEEEFVLLKRWLG